MYQIPTTTYSPEEIFAGQVPALSINFFNTDNNTNKSISEISTTISKWYVTLRNISIIGLQVILVYVGIRMLTSSIAEQKAKYKQLFVDWLIALCLIFVLHYLMLFVVNLTNTLCEAIGGNASKSIEIKIIGSDRVGPESFETNLLGEVRFLTQYKRLVTKITYAILYLFLVCYTIYFTFVYLKRLLIMAFLTVIAPLVALTYPIDKMNDGSAQAFNAWLKEYVYNALIQPFHLILYVVLVSSANQLVQSNFLYAIVAIWFITKAEGLLRQIFGFNKAPSLGNTMGGFAGGMVASNLLKSIKGGSGSKKGVGSGGNSSNSGEKDKVPRFAKKPGVDGIAEAFGSTTSTNNGQPQTPTTTSGSNNANGANIRMAGGGGLGSQTPGTQATGTQGGTPSLAGTNPSNRNYSNKEKISNWFNAHRGVGNGNKKRIKGVVKTAGKFAGTTAGAAVGALGGLIPGAIAGKGITGMVAGAITGGKMGSVAGSKVADMAVNAPKNLKGFVGKQIDFANGNTHYQDAAEIRETKENEDNLQYVKDMMTADLGRAPSKKELKEKMESYTPYMEKGMRDIKTITKADKIANKYEGLSPEKVAQIAALGQAEGITKEDLSGKENLKKTTKNLQQKFMDANYDKDTSKMLTQKSLDVLKALNGVSHDLRRK